jgi:hypothetical protein
VLSLVELQINLHIYFQLFEGIKFLTCVKQQAKSGIC